MSKKAIKHSQRNTPVRKSIRVRKDKAAEATRREQIAETQPHRPDSKEQPR